MRRLLALPFALVLAGCGATGTNTVATSPQPRSAPGTERVENVLVTVVDGNTHARVRGALVTVGSHQGYPDTNTPGPPRGGPGVPDVR